MKNSITNLYEQIKAAIPQDQIDSHASDLYVLVTPQSSEIIKNYEFKNNVTTFIGQCEPYKGKRWYDVHFCYQPYWDTRIASKKLASEQKELSHCEKFYAHRNANKE